MNTIGKIRAKIHGEVFDYQVLVDALAEYRKPRDKITRLLATGAIVRTKKGLYCFGEPFRKEHISPELWRRWPFVAGSVAVVFG